MQYYRGEVPNTTFYSHLLIDPSGYYGLIIFNDYINDIIGVPALFSVGSYFCKGSLMFFKDLNSNCTMTAIKTLDGNIKFTTGFSFMTKHVEYSPIQNINPDVALWHEEIIKEPINQKNSLSYPAVAEIDSSSHEICQGFYALKETTYRHSGDYDYGISLRNNHTYEYRMCKYIVSCGSWKREKNEIVLHDIYVNGDFRLAIIGDNLIQSLSIPGDYYTEPIILKNITPKK
jgi:hypothetical protein